MSVSIIACPTCNTMLLSDTAQCPTCKHVLDETRLREFPETQKPPTSDLSVVEDQCPNCSEMVRRGLVRCWNCGTFMRKDIAESYQKMKASPSRVIYSLPPGEDEKVKISLDDTPEPAQKMIGDDDFELAPEIEAAQREDDGFETAPGVAVEESSDNSETYGLPNPPVTKPAKEKTVKAEASQTATSPEKTAKEAPPPAETPSEENSESDKDNSSSDKDNAADEKSKQQRTETEESDGPTEAHSVATGGDVLLQVALEEEAEVGRRRGKGPRRRAPSHEPKDGIKVFCPNGHRVFVREKFRGMTGKCPKCKSPFFVPAETWDTAPPDEKVDETGEKTDDVVMGSGADEAAGKFKGWMTDVHLHTVCPTKIKLKPGSLKAAFQTIDVGFSEEGLLIVTVAKKSGLLGSKDKKKTDEARVALKAHLAEDKSLEELPAVNHHFFEADAAREIRVVQPVVYDHESMFAGVPVFGESRIAVRLPKKDKTDDPQFLSFALSDFRTFSKLVSEFLGIYNFGEENEIPLADVCQTVKCHYGEQEFQHLDNVEFYQDDAGFELKLVGRKCAECGLVISEDARKKEKIGGKTGKAIAKAKCPKCEKKFGNISLFNFEKPPATEATSESETTESNAEKTSTNEKATNEKATNEKTASDEKASSENNKESSEPSEDGDEKANGESTEKQTAEVSADSASEESQTAK